MNSSATPNPHRLLGRARPTTPSPMPPRRGAAGTPTQIIANVESVIDGKHAAVRTALTVLLAEGHLLIEDVPGVGKTMLAKALAEVRRLHASAASSSRPTCCPSDVTGVSIYNQAERAFEFKPGAVFANIVIGDEINRAIARRPSRPCSSAWRSARSPSTAPPTRCPTPFTVVATQNPIEMEGTYALPEAQRDRFMARISMGYPDAENEVAMLTHARPASPLEQIERGRRRSRSCGR